MCQTMDQQFPTCANNYEPREKEIQKELKKV